MILQQTLAEQYERLEAQTRESSVILLHPASLYRSALVAYLLRFARRPTFYYALTPDDMDVNSFINSLLRSLSYQHPTFGRHLSLVDRELEMQQDPRQIQPLIDALVRELSELSREPYYLIFDEFDRCDESDEIQLLIELLIDQMPPNCHLIINSRTFPRLSWIARIVSRRALVFADDGVVQQHFYGSKARASTGVRLDILSLGPGFVLLDDRPVDAWEGHLPRLLLFFAMERPSVTRSEICAAFWPGLQGEQAVNVFHVTKRRLHKAIRKGIEGFEILTHSNGRYHINPHVELAHDAEEFAIALLHARMHPSDNQAAWLSQAIELYRGPYLQGHHDDWIIRRRKDYENGFIEALTRLAAIREAEQRTDVALQYLLKAASVAPSNLELHGSVIRAYLALGRRSEASAYLLRILKDAPGSGLIVPQSFIQQQQQIIN